MRTSVLSLLPNVGTSLSCPRTPYLSLVKAGLAEGPHGMTHPTSPGPLALGPLTLVVYAATGSVCCRFAQLQPCNQHGPNATMAGDARPSPRKRCCASTPAARAP